MEALGADVDRDDHVVEVVVDVVGKATGVEDYSRDSVYYLTVMGITSGVVEDREFELFNVGHHVGVPFSRVRADFL